MTGDLNIVRNGYDISDEIVRRLQPTLMITIGALLVFGAARARPGNLLSGERQESAWRRRRLLPIGVAIPTFWAGLLLVLVFGVRLGWLPTGGYVPFGDDPVECLRSIILPILALTGESPRCSPDTLHLR